MKIRKYLIIILSLTLLIPPIILRSEELKNNIKKCDSDVISETSNISPSSESYVFVTKWGSEGNGNEQFKRAKGIGVDSDGNIYVSDSSNECIKKFDSNGNFIIKWGSDGEEDGNFILPGPISLDSNGYVYVVDRGNHRIQKFDSNGKFVTKWGSDGKEDGQFEDPLSIAINPDGYVYVLDGRENIIKKFDLRLYTFCIYN